MAKNEINAFLGTGTKYKGRLEFHGIVRVDGFFEGDIVSDGTLVVGKEAVVKGEIAVGMLMCSGRIEAAVRAAKKVTLHKTAHYQGDIQTPSLIIEEGARMEGEVSMSADPDSPPALT